jgi:putative transposase
LECTCWRALRYDALMFVRFLHLLGWVISVFRSREELLLENLALRQQLLALHAKRPRSRLGPVDRLFWVVLRRSWSGWKRSLILVTPETVVLWHRTGFRLYWSWISRARKAVGRKPISREVRELIFRMVAENPTWGAPRIHGELLKLGFDISERTVSRWVKRATRNPDPARRWLVFLRNHREAIVAMDFFTVPTLTFGVLYCFFVIGHDRRKILHCNVTLQPNAFWIVLQLREAWGYDLPNRFLIFDRDAKFSADVVSAVKQNGTCPNCFSQSLAERHRRALGWKCAQRLA